MLGTSAAVRRCPLKVTVPLSGAVMWFMILINVVFPAPLGPSSP